MRVYVNLFFLTQRETVLLFANRLHHEVEIIIATSNLNLDNLLYHPIEGRLMLSFAPSPPGYVDSNCVMFIGAVLYNIHNRVTIIHNIYSVQIL